VKPQGLGLSTVQPVGVVFCQVTVTGSLSLFPVTLAVRVTE